MVESYISRKLTKKADELLVRKWDVLISRSGTIGNVGIASEVLAGKAVSEDVIRVRADDPRDAGYVVAFLRCKYGRLQIVQATYGSVIKHIEPLHLPRVYIPDLKEQRRSLGQKIIRAYQLRGEANELLSEADDSLHRLLKLPAIADHRSDEGPVVASQRASLLLGRFEASFHDPLAQAAEMILTKTKIALSSLGDASITSEIRAITKFRSTLGFHRTTASDS